MQQKITSFTLRSFFVLMLVTGQSQAVNWDWKKLALVSYGTILAIGALRNVLEIKNQNDLLVQAAKKGDIEAVKQYLDQGADINTQDEYGFTPLHLACYAGYTEIVKLLIAQNGININAQDNDGRTPLHYACQWGFIEIVKLLLSQTGININVQDKYKNTPLHDACWHGNREVIQLLLDRKDIDINAKSKNGWTALHLACENEDIEIVKLLIENGINMFALNREKQTAFNLATDNDIKKYLTSVENEGKAFIVNPLKPTTTESPSTYFKMAYFMPKKAYGMECKEINYKTLMYLYGLGNEYGITFKKLIDECEFDKKNMSCMGQVHNFPKSSKELAMTDSLVSFKDFDLNFCYL